MKPTPKAFPAQFKTFTLLHKIAALVRRFKVTHRQLAWLCDYGPSMGWLDLAVLPAAPGDPPAPFADWLRLVDLFQLRDGLPAGETTLAGIFDLARTQRVSQDEPVPRFACRIPSWVHGRWRLSSQEKNSFPPPFKKVDAAGIITTVAGNGTIGSAGDGGPATSAQFN